MQRRGWESESRRDRVELFDQGRYFTARTLSQWERTTLASSISQFSLSRSFVVEVSPIILVINPTFEAEFPDIMARTKIWKGFFFLFVLLVVVVDGKRRGARRHRKISNSTEFDVLIFTQHWPQTVCYTWKEKSSKHECSLPADEEWSIHGIWPTKYHVIGPLYCNNSLPFNIEALVPLEQELEIKWIDIEKGTKHHAFWTHEWEKHGTCAAVLEPLNTEFKYFKEGLTLLDTYDMKHVLAQASIMPGENYKIQTILNSVEKVLGKRVQVQCVMNSKTKETYLFEVRICFDKKLNLVDCDGIPGFPTNCSHKKDIIYPGSVPVNYHVVQI